MDGFLGDTKFTGINNLSLYLRVIYHDFNGGDNDCGSGDANDKYASSAFLKLELRVMW